jgi:CHAD domain-containing protein
MATLPSTFETLSTELAEALVACRSAPGSRAVQSLRIAVRRIEALLHAMAEDHPQAQRLQINTGKALRQLKKVRRAAGPVRDLDVQRRLIAEIVSKASASRSVEGQESLGREGSRLDARLHRRRKDSAAKLTSVVRKAEPKLKRSLGELAETMAGGHPLSLLNIARRLVLRSSLHLEDASPEALHVYRKRAKAARYLAEMETTSTPAQRLAKSLKRVLDAIGRWHDLLLLVEETKTVLGKQSTLVEAIRAERERAWRVAVRSAGSVRPMP